MFMEDVVIKGTIDVGRSHIFGIRYSTKRGMWLLIYGGDLKIDWIYLWYKLHHSWTPGRLSGVYVYVNTTPRGLYFSISATLGSSLVREFMSSFDLCYDLNNAPWKTRRILNDSDSGMYSSRALKRIRVLIDYSD